VRKLKDCEISVANEKDIYISKMCMPQQVKVTVHLPENIMENARQQKINRIYDILAHKNSR